MICLKNADQGINHSEMLQNTMINVLMGIFLCSNNPKLFSRGKEEKTSLLNTWKGDIFRAENQPTDYRSSS